jgi:hypothetical protein
MQAEIAHLGTWHLLGIGVSRKLDAVRTRWQKNMPVGSPLASALVTTRSRTASATQGCACWRPALQHLPGQWGAFALDAVLAPALGDWTRPLVRQAIEPIDLVPLDMAAKTALAVPQKQRRRNLRPLLAGPSVTSLVASHHPVLLRVAGPALGAPCIALP